ncbi:STAS domain-containing protein [Microcella alkaliphila]|uniref:Anti-sigma factor antagonist n=1 Tax=Microcella alkaliphila TaxID=279828 RepID=A0A0U4WU72_9MICO|nr:STAS domain-containing protein [Microcella alkaliphila]BAU31431.1 anti-sigma-factor antagonist [Microcella alkaliphila]
MKIDVVDGPGGVVVLKPEGRLNMVAAPAVREAVSSIVDSGRSKVAVDLSGVEFIDSSGLGALISGLKTTRQAGGDLRIAGANDQVKLMLSLTNLERVLTPYDTVENAYGDA